MVRSARGRLILSLDLNACKRSQKGHYCRGLADILQQTTFDISHGNRPPARLSRPWNPELETASTSDFWKNIHHMSLNATTFENCSSPTCEMSSNKSDATLDQLKTSESPPAEGDDHDAPPEEPPMTARELIRATVDLMHFLALVSYSAMFIAVWAAIPIYHLIFRWEPEKLPLLFWLAAAMLALLPVVQAPQARLLQEPWAPEASIDHPPPPPVRNFGTTLPLTVAFVLTRM